MFHIDKLLLDVSGLSLSFLPSHSFVLVPFVFFCSILKTYTSAINIILIALCLHILESPYVLSLTSNYEKSHDSKPDPTRLARFLFFQVPMRRCQLHGAASPPLSKRHQIKRRHVNSTDHLGHQQPCFLRR